MVHRHSLDMFEIFYENLERQLEELFSIVERTGTVEGEIVPPCDIYECSNNIYIDLELPGIKKKDISITLQSGVLHIQAIKQDDDKEQIKRSHICIERNFGTVYRKIELKWPCDTNQIRATVKNGLLTITIPKIEDRRGKVKKIEVEEG
jgi:HSP20 family protein